MIKTTTTISNKLGLHARASAKLTKLAGSFPCDVFLSRGERRVNAKSIMGVMMLAAGIGTAVVIETSGEREQEAMDAWLLDRLEDWSKGREKPRIVAQPAVAMEAVRVVCRQRSGRVDCSLASELRRLVAETSVPNARRRYPSAPVWRIAPPGSEAGSCSTPRTAARAGRARRCWLSEPASATEDVWLKRDQVPFVADPVLPNPPRRTPCLYPREALP